MIRRGLSSLAAAKRARPAPGGAILRAAPRVARPPLLRPVPRTPLPRAPARALATAAGPPPLSAASAPEPDPLPAHAGISLWLFACAGVVFAIVLVGGATRLTRSGLSMTDWKPQGSLPPVTDEEWEAEFEKYKQFPEYKRLNKGMTLSEFKFIFYMEWGHRMLGRFAGVLFGVPLLVMASRGMVTGRLARRLGLLLGLGAAQGGVGWWMVRSGLKEREDDPYWEPKVSPYRLATHLLSALTIYSLLLDTALKTMPATRLGGLLAACPTGVSPPALRGLRVALGLLAATIASGAFVAGNRAGLVYNEWPLMGGGLVPPDLVDPALKPVWRNAFENSSAVQFDHRMLAYGTFGAVSVAWLRTLGMRLPPNGRLWTHLFMLGATTQVGLGILTLLTMVPVNLGVAHQATALATLTAGITTHHVYGKATRSLPAGGRLAAAAAAAAAAGAGAAAAGGAARAGGRAAASRLGSRPPPRFPTK